MQRLLTYKKSLLNLKANTCNLGVLNKPSLLQLIAAILKHDINIVINYSPKITNHQMSVKSNSIEKLPRRNKRNAEGFFAQLSGISSRAIEKHKGLCAPALKWNRQENFQQRISWSVFYASASNFKHFHSIRRIFIFSSRWNFVKDGWKKSELGKAS